MEPEFNAWSSNDPSSPQAVAAVQRWIAAAIQLWEAPRELRCSRLGDIYIYIYIYIYIHIIDIDRYINIYIYTLYIYIYIVEDG